MNQLNDEQVRFYSTKWRSRNRFAYFDSCQLGQTYDDAACLVELVDSKQQLEQLTGKAVNSFAYPFGIYSHSVM